MKIVQTLDETLNGGFRGLHSEVVESDVYRLRTLDFQPDVVFDVGANVGVFSRHARSLFPHSLIVAVEPHPENLVHFKKFTKDPHLVLHEAALGFGSIYHGLTARNGSGETYLPTGLGYPMDAMHREALRGVALELAACDTICLAELVDRYYEPGMRCVMKIDCEGAENCIWEHLASMNALLKMEYICMELHYYALTAKELPAVKEVTDKALRRLSQTHRLEREHVHLYARKEPLC